jgi:chorismate dehydratase
MPFVFAVWAANKSLPESFINLFNNALLHGLNNIDESISHFPNSLLSHNDARKYLTNNISYSLDETKRKALDKFLLLAKSLEPG